MNIQDITAKLPDFRRFLIEAERSKGTIEKYLRDVKTFALFLDDRDLSKEMVLLWKSNLFEKGYAPATSNSMIAALNTFWGFVGMTEYKVKPFKLQRRIFREQSKELSLEDYKRLVAAAESRGNERLALIIETICSCGIRVSELRFITVESALRGSADILLKGKLRTIMLPGKLCRKLIKYTKKRKITSGEIFLTKKGKGIDRKQIWAEMKALCTAAKVDKSKVFPHNLRHLFAKTFYKACRDIVKLSDILGHSCIETTRIYLISTGNEHAARLNRLGLVS